MAASPLQYIGWSGAGISVLDSAYSSLRLQNILESVTGLIAQELPGTVFSGRINADMTASFLWACRTAGWSSRRRKPRRLCAIDRLRAEGFIL